MNRVVICMKWGQLYGPDYVNVLYNAVRSNLSGAFRFVCLTDDDRGFIPEIESHPIPEIGCIEAHWKGGGWPKLSVFRNDLYGLHGRALFIDLDSAILGPIDALFEGTGFRAIGGGPEWRPGRVPVDPKLLTGVFAFDLGAHGDIVRAFAADPERAVADFGIEQKFVEHQVETWKPWPPDWVISFKRHLCQPLFLDRILPPKSPPQDTKIVAFHGKPRPADLLKENSSWATFPHYGRGKVKWVEAYWRGNGGAAV